MGSVLGRWLRGTVLAVACGALCACVTLNYNRELQYVPLSDEAVEAMRPGETDLTAALAELGAPLYVWPTSADGLAIAYGWFNEVAWNVSVSVPVTSNLSASFDYDQADVRLQGVVLFFDEDDQLVDVRRGLLVDLARGTRLPPPVEEDLGG